MSQGVRRPGKERKQFFLVRRVVGKSMCPALNAGQVVVAVRHWRYRPGDVVVFRHAGCEKIKRIFRVTGTGFEVHGDNSAHSTDSRQFGPVEKNAILGCVVWPFRAL